mmetsp:Transcript_17727/g.40691  ORF Transcript_17727/g.40691 Transcript_17727/m.40691 type:complete len:381 (+) Transcript_17727:186-1328(+)
MPDLSTDDGVDWDKSITSILEGSDSDDVRKVKKLRKMVLLSLQIDESDKAAKKLFKKAVQNMEEQGKVKLDADGTISLLEKRSKKKKRKASSSNDDDDDEEREKKSKKKKKKDKKRQKTSGNGSDDDDHDEGEGGAENDEAGNDNEEETSTADKNNNNNNNNNTPTTSSADKNKPCKGNPQGVTRLFLGNLPFSVDESSLNAFLPGQVTHIKWITDKETGKFYGSAFIEMDNSISASDAVAMAGSKLIGRPVKINFAPARDGDVWPPPKKVISGGGNGNSNTTGGQAGGTGVKAMSVKPDNCLKLFIGNLSYDIDDEGIIKFFANVDAEVKAVRWLHHKDSGDFKGVGFVEFWNTEACERGATLNGKSLLGRPIRIDWTD